MSGKSRKCETNTLYSIFNLILRNNFVIYTISFKHMNDWGIVLQISSRVKMLIWEPDTECWTLLVFKKFSIISLNIWKIRVTFWRSPSNYTFFKEYNSIIHCFTFKNFEWKISWKLLVWNAVSWFTSHFKRGGRFFSWLSREF